MADTLKGRLVPWRLACVAEGLGCLLALSCAPLSHHQPAHQGGAATGFEAARAGVVRLARIDTRGFGTWSGLRVGDMNGDGIGEVVLAQNVKQEITCLTAVDMAGRQLWQWGACSDENYGTSYDLAVQVCDLDEDGVAEVVCARGGEVVVLDGRSGRVVKAAPLPSPGAMDALLLCHLGGQAAPPTVVIKDRYRTLWALGPGLEVLWRYEGNVGHFPWPYDLDGDGRDEIVCGHLALDDDGQVLWEVELPGHADAVAIGDIDGEPANGVEIAVATCVGGVVAVVGRDGVVRWQTPLQHAQHVVVGDFRPDLPGLEVAAVDRGVDRSPAGVDALVLFAADGTMLWREHRSDKGTDRWLTVISPVARWNAGVGDLILAYRRGGSLVPRLLDGWGRVVAEFPIDRPTAQHFAMHADLSGDGRDEIVVWNEQEVAVFAIEFPTFTAPPPRPARRMCNWTHYSGMP